MKCKNCKSELTANDSFCNICGAKIVNDRITIKSLFSNFLFSLGWDSNFFITLRFLLYKPQTVLKEYINGTRKKYTNPFTFFAISLAFSLFVFNQYSEQFIQMSTTPDLQQVEKTDNTSFSDNSNENRGLKILGYNSQAEFQKAIVVFQLKYYNLMSFLYLPFFTLMAFFVFRKPYNYGEHLVINTYILSITTFLGVLLFIFSLLTKINILFYATFFTFLYFFYLYKKLYELSFGRLLLKILKFLGVLLIFFILSLIIGGIIGFVLAMKKNKV